MTPDGDASFRLRRCPALTQVSDSSASCWREGARTLRFFARPLPILITAREWTQDYEWHVHAPIALILHPHPPKKFKDE